MSWLVTRVGAACCMVTKAAAAATSPEGPDVSYKQQSLQFRLATDRLYLLAHMGVCMTATEPNSKHSPSLCLIWIKDQSSI